MRHAINSFAVDGVVLPPHHFSRNLSQVPSLHVAQEVRENQI